MASSSQSEYLVGSIVSIEVVDFMSYTNCKFNPGPRLNLVIGPNGTGKSALVCALIVGLGGELKSIGRASSYGSYVRYGCNEASIIIRLHQGEGKPPMVVRTQVYSNKEDTYYDPSDVETYGDKVFYYLDEKKISKTELRTKLQLWNIQTDNLTQFLAQDKVGEFSKLDDRGLLRETENAVLGPAVKQAHEEVINKQKDVRQRSKETNALQGKQQQSMNDLNKLSGEWTQYKSRSSMISELDDLKAIRPWVAFEEEKNRAKNFKLRKEEAEEALKIAKTLIEPLKAKLDEAREGVANHDESQKATTNLMKKSESELTKAKEDLVNPDNCSLSELVEKLQEYEDRKLKAKDKIKKAEASLFKTQQEYDNILPADKLAQHNEEITEEKNSLKNEEIILKGKADQQEEVLHEAKAKAAEFDNIRRQLNNVENQKKERIRKLRNYKKYLDGFEFTNGKGKTRLQAKVYGPLLLEIQVEDDYVAQMLEHQLPAEHFGMFVTLNKHDDDIMTNEVGNGIQTALYLDSKFQIEERRPFSDEFLKNFGIIGYLDELIKAERPVLNTLITASNLHLVLIGTAETEKFVLTQDLCSSILGKKLQEIGFNARVVLYTPTQRHTISISKYGKRDVVVQSVGLNDGGKGDNYTRLLRGTRPPNRNVNSSSSFNARGGGINNNNNNNNEDDDLSHEDKVARNNENLRIAQGHVQQIEKKLNDIKEEIKKVHARILDLEKKSRNIAAQMKEKQTLKKTIASLKNGLETLQSASSKDYSKDIASTKEEIKVELKKRIKYAENLTKRCTSFTQAFQKFAECESKLSTLQCRVSIAENNLFVRSADVRKKESTFHTLEKAFNESLGRAKQKKAIADKTPLTEHLKSVISNLEQATLAHVDDEIALKQQQIENIVIAPGFLERYLNLEKLVKSQGEELTLSKVKLEEAQKILDDKLNIWLLPVQEMIKQLDEALRNFFSQVEEKGFRCAAEVRLVGDNIDEVTQEIHYEKFGIGLFVRFRQDQPMAQLSATIHSGGERSLTTFLYMLALQNAGNAKQAPFRVVDEINQGMDEDKERIAYYRLVGATCGRKDRPQYFLVTPKLLNGLHYPKDATVAFIFNGVKSISQNEWNFDKFMKRKRGETYEPNDENSQPVAGGNEIVSSRPNKRKSTITTY